ncbi:hypothetical protein BJX70DRAFT_363211 [Aspergillus crustosus]
MFNLDLSKTNWCGTSPHLPPRPRPFIMPHIQGQSQSQSTLKPSRVKLIQHLKKDIPADQLKTVPPGTPIPRTFSSAAGSGSGSAQSLKQYPCSSQKPTPAAITGCTSKAALQVGLGSTIPRWNPGQTINYAVLERGYPQPEQEHAALAAAKLQEAADEWNKCKVGVQFNWVEDLEDAVFVLMPARQRIPGVLAEAFFPNDLDLNNLNVYPYAFERGTVEYLKNIFLHELGHVLGLRHEFAPELEADERSVQVGPRDATSVMSYEFPPEIQASDIESTRVFYRFVGKQLGVQQHDVPLRIVNFDANN